MHLQQYLRILGGEPWLQLSQHPPGRVLCPYQALTIFCTHSPTLNQPDWIVEKNTKQIFRSLNFKNSGLEHHRIVNDTTEAEVLLIDQVLPEFNGLRYSCLYDTVGGPVTSNVLALNLLG